MYEMEEKFRNSWKVLMLKICDAKSNLHFSVFCSFLSTLFQSLFCFLFLLAPSVALVLEGSQESSGTAAPAPAAVRNLGIREAALAV